ncbi:MAG: preprotein translocase subunit SecY [Candidatus Verstraetearchaeota archaeon]|nr:preprotein translocase subunit SecY [Candidatus Verstraetearchaeota archaeon]
MPRFLELMEPLVRRLPEIPKPQRKVNLKEKAVWSILALAIYLIMSEIPLYGVPYSSDTFEQFLIYRIIFASKKGTLMDLGIGPIVTAGLIMQILAGSKILNVDMSNPKDRGLFTGTQKIFAIVMTVVEGLAFLLGGSYGSTSAVTSVFIIGQLLAVGIFVLLLDEMLQKGWGLGSGISLFILAGVAQTVVWNLFSPVGPVYDGKSLGAIIAFFQTAFSGENILAVFNRYPYPDMVGFFAMLLVFFVAVYLEGMKIEIPVAYAKYGGMRAKIPLKFLYVSNIPVILTSALFANFYFLGQVLWRNFNQDNSNMFLNWFVQYDANQTVMPGTFLYYISAPRSLSAVAHDPVHALLYVLILVGFSVLFARIWVEVSGMSARAQAEQLVNAGLQIPGFRRSPAVVESMLNRYIPSLTIISGITIGLLAGTADMLGAIGSGIGILLSVGIIYQYYQILAKEQLAETYPGLGRLLGQE